MRATFSKNLVCVCVCMCVCMCVCARARVRVRAYKHACKDHKGANAHTHTRTHTHTHILYNAFSYYRMCPLTTECVLPEALDRAVDEQDVDGPAEERVRDHDHRLSLRRLQLLRKKRKNK